MLESAPALRVFYIAINTTRGPLSDKRVRQALNYAVDAKGILNGIVSGRGNLAAGVIPPALPGGDSTRKGYTRDVAKAKQLLAEAGFANGIDVELWSSQTPPFPRIAQTVQAYLKEANVRVTLVQRDASSMREAARAGNLAKLFDIYEKQLATSGAREQLDELTSIVQSGQPVCLLCYERHVDHCHRKRLAELICERTDVEVEHLAAPLY